MDSTLVECDVASQTPEGETKAEAAAPSEGSSAVCHSWDVPKESATTSSTDTDSPVMISVDVRHSLHLYTSTQITVSGMTAPLLFFRRWAQVTPVRSLMRKTL